jgi:hypothetical protein
MYGNPNVGGQGTTSYTVGSLSPGKRYYFTVQAVNGCSPGGFSNEISAVSGGTAVSIPTLTQIPATEMPLKTEGQNNVPPTDIPGQDDIALTNTPPTQNIQPTTRPPPTQASIINTSKSEILLFISVGILVIGSIGNYLYWKQKKNTDGSTNTTGESQNL